MKTQLKAFTWCLMCLVALTSIAWAQSSDPNVRVAQAPAQARLKRRDASTPKPANRIPSSSVSFLRV